MKTTGCFWVVFLGLAALTGCGGEADGAGAGGTSATGGASGSAASGGTSGASSGGTAGASGGAAGASGGSAGASGGSAGASGGSAGAGGIGGAGGAGGAGGCVPQTGTGGFAQPTCADLNRMDVKAPVLDDAGKDGKLSPGEAFSFQVDLVEVAGLGFNFYPAVEFGSDHPDVKLSGGDQFFAILACTSMPTKGTGQVGANVPAGTKVKLTARVTALNMTCPAAPSLEFPVTIQ